MKILRDFKRGLFSIVDHSKRRGKTIPKYYVNFMLHPTIYSKSGRMKTFYESFGLTNGLVIAYLMRRIKFLVYIFLPLKQQRIIARVV